MLFVLVINKLSNLISAVRIQVCVKPSLHSENQNQYLTSKKLVDLSQFDHKKGAGKFAFTLKIVLLKSSETQEATSYKH